MTYLITHWGNVVWLAWQHLLLAGTATAIAIAIALPVSFFTQRSARLSIGLLGSLGIVYTIPSIALIILLVPVLGLNGWSVIVALIFYTLVILLRNFTTGLHTVAPAILEAARGMGMSAWQVWWRVQLPLALPVMIAGVRIALVVAVGIATIGGKFGAGGLGALLFEGVANSRYDKVIAGAVAVAALALGLNSALTWVERKSWASTRAYSRTKCD